MNIRRAVAGDAEPASLVLRRSITELCMLDHENDPALLASWLANKTPEKFKYWAEAEDGLCLVATDDDGATSAFCRKRARSSSIMSRPTPGSRASARL